MWHLLDQAIEIKFYGLYSYRIDLGLKHCQLINCHELRDQSNLAEILLHRYYVVIESFFSFLSIYSHAQFACFILFFE